MIQFNGMFHLWLVTACVIVVDVGSFNYPGTPKQPMKTTLRLNKAVERQTHHLDIHIRNMERSLKQILAETLYKTLYTKEDYASNPVAALTMVRRLTEDWTAMAGTVRGLTSESLRYRLGNVRWPTAKDLEATTKAVAKAQVVYSLDTELLAQGSLNNITFFADMTAMDGFNIAKVHIKKHHYAEAASWLQHSLSRISRGDASAPQHSVLQHLTTALCYTGDSKECRHLLTNVIRKYPIIKTPKNLIVQYFNISLMDCNTLVDAANDLKKYNDFGVKDKDEDIEAHSRLCRGEGKVDTRLRCRYVHYQQPHLRFQPFKLEELQRDPPVLRFYDALTDVEADTLKKDALTKMEPSLVFGIDGKPTVNEFRTSFIAWLQDTDTEIGKRLVLRMSDMTRLNVNYADPHQVSSYALSGGYQPHNDFLGGPLQFDRVATLMYYLTEVKQGGNTVFLRSDLSVAPVKNSAILWFNYRPDGKFDRNSFHSGCPVLQGRKWVLNKWIWNRGGLPCVGNYTESYKHYYIE